MMGHQVLFSIIIIIKEHYLRQCFCVTSNNVALRLNFEYEQNTYKRPRKLQYSQVRKCMFSRTSDADFQFVIADFSCSLINKVKHINRHKDG